MKTDRYILAFDAGSSYIKSVLIDAAGTIIAKEIVVRGADIDTSCRTCFNTVLSRAAVDKDHIDRIIATGYGRKQVPFADQVITEITALAVGGFSIAPQARVLIDVGGQDSKVISMDASGQVIDFAMNHKCAAGTGKFLEVTSASLGVDVAQLGPLSQKADKSLQLTSTCTVFAESEIVSLIANGQSKENIIKALHTAIAGQVISLYHQVSPPDSGDILFVGGVAQNEGMVSELSTRLNRPLRLPQDPQYIGAYGAALFLKNHQP